MTPAIGIGLKLTARVGSNWPQGLPRVDTILPCFYLDAPDMWFAHDDGNGLQAMSLAQLDEKIISTCDAHYVEDGDGGYTEIAANQLPLSRAGLQAHPMRTNLVKYSARFGSGAWSPLNSPTITNDYATAPDGSETAVRMETTTGATRGCFQSSLSHESGVTQAISVFIADNGGQDKAVLIGVGQGAFGGTGGDRSTLFNLSTGTFSSTHADIDSVKADPAWFGGVSGWRVQLTFTPTATGSNGAVILYGSDVELDILVWVYQLEEGAYATDPIITEGSAITLPASRNILPYAGGAFALAAEIDLRGFENGTVNRMLDINNGSNAETASIAIASSGAFQFYTYKSGSYVNGSNSGVASQGTYRLAGVLGVDYLKFGVIGAADGPTRTSIGSVPNINSLALDGVGFNTTTLRASKYLRKLALWPIGAGSDDVFNAVKGVAEDWAQ